MQRLPHLKYSIPQGPVGIAFHLSTFESRKVTVCTEGGMLFILFGTVSVWLTLCAVSSSHYMLHFSRTRGCCFPSVSFKTSYVACRRRYVLCATSNIIDSLCDILIPLGSTGVSLSLCQVESMRLGMCADEGIYLCNSHH